MAEPTLRNRISGIAGMFKAGLFKADMLEAGRMDAKSRALRPAVVFGSRVSQWFGTQQPGTRQFGTPGRVAWVFALLSALVWMGLSTEAVQAQSSTSFRVYPQLLRDVESAGVQVADAAGAEQNGPRLIIVDTDPGVDDAAALAWLLSQSEYEVEILGIVATAGNASLEDATRNVLILRELAGATHIPVFQGLHRPLVQTLSDTGLLIHGMDGLWSAADVYPHALPEPERLAAWRFYCHVGRELSGATIVTLGPLTNVARALRACAADMANFGELVILGGAQVGGNTTPVAEFNIWQDPQAAELVLESGLDITLIPLDTFTSLQFTFGDLFPLATSPNPLGPFLGCVLGVCPPDFPSGDPVADGGVVGLSPLGLYLNIQLQAVGEASVPDVAAVMYALDSSLGVTTTALAKVMLRPELVRGQTIIGTGDSSKVTMIVDDRELSRLAQAAYSEPPPFPLPPGLQLPNPGILQDGIDEILAREPDNVDIATSIDVAEMRARFFAALTAPLPVTTAGANMLMPRTLSLPELQLFVPAVVLNE